MSGRLYISAVAAWREEMGKQRLSELGFEKGGLFSKQCHGRRGAEFRESKEAWSVRYRFWYRPTTSGELCVFTAQK